MKKRRRKVPAPGDLIIPNDELEVPGFLTTEAWSLGALVIESKPTINSNVMRLKILYNSEIDIYFWIIEHKAHQIETFLKVETLRT